jgi:surface antigen
MSAAVLGSMRAKLLTTLVVGTTLSVTSACATQRGTGAATGAVAGGAIGAAVGDTTGLLLGAALGGLIGHEVGRAMEREDERRLLYSLERDQPVQWRNPNTGYEYAVEPIQSYESYGRECREFRMHADVGPETESVYGTACRAPDGTWDLAG